MTSDGIAKRDWDRILDLASKVTNELNTNNESNSLAKLFRALSKLENKYGALPSILATRGDYEHDDQLAIHLLEKAFSAANKLGDIKNMAFCAHSLVDRYLDGMKSRIQARKWLKILKECLDNFDDKYLMEEYLKLNDQLRVRKKHLQ